MTNSYGGIEVTSVSHMNHEVVVWTPTAEGQPLAFDIEHTLSARGWRVARVAALAEAVARARSRATSAVILDAREAAVDTPGLCRLFDDAGLCPVVLVANEDDPTERVLALEMGAEDVISGPMAARQVLARLNVLARRHRSAGADRLRTGDWSLDPRRRQLMDPAGRAVELSSTEHDLLMLFLRSPGAVLSGNWLMSRLGLAGPLAEDTLRTRISRLRRRLGSEPDGTERLRTLRGQGFILADPLYVMASQVTAQTQLQPA